MTRLARYVSARLAALSAGTVVVLWVVGVVLAYVVVVGWVIAAFDPADPAATPPRPSSTVTTDAFELIPPMSATSPSSTSATASTVAATSSTRTVERSSRPSDWPWGPLADCESGEWDDHAPLGVVAGSRNWADRRGGYEGGVHFDPGTWTSYRPAGFPDHAYQATADQQVTVAQLVLADQGWAHGWPTCSLRIGAR